MSDVLVVMHLDGTRLPKIALVSSNTPSNAIYVEPGSMALVIARAGEHSIILRGTAHWIEVDFQFASLGLHQIPNAGSVLGSDQVK